MWTFQPKMQNSTVVKAQDIVTRAMMSCSIRHEQQSKWSSIFVVNREFRIFSRPYKWWVCCLEPVSSDSWRTCLVDVVRCTSPIRFCCLWCLSLRSRRRGNCTWRVDASQVSSLEVNTGGAVSCVIIIIIICIRVQLLLVYSKWIVVSLDWCNRRQCANLKLKYI